MNGWHVLEIVLGSALIIVLPSPYVPNGSRRGRFYNFFLKRGPRASLVLTLIFGAAVLFFGISALAAHEPFLFIFACCSGAASIAFMFQRQRALVYIASQTDPMPPPAEEDVPWWRRPLWVEDDYSRGNQMRKAIWQGLALVAVMALGATSGFQGGGHLPGRWYYWTGGATAVYLIYLACVQPWSARSRAEMAKSDPTHLSPETEAWLRGGPPPTTAQEPGRPAQSD